MVMETMVAHTKSAQRGLPRCEAADASVTGAVLPVPNAALADIHSKRTRSTYHTLDNAGG
jgi:hypothetical protein